MFIKLIKKLLKFLNIYISLIKIRCIKPCPSPLPQMVSHRFLLCNIKICNSICEQLLKKQNRAALLDTAI